MTPHAELNYYIKNQCKKNITIKQLNNQTFPLDISTKKKLFFVEYNDQNDFWDTTNNIKERYNLKKINEKKVVGQKHNLLVIQLSNE